MAQRIGRRPFLATVLGSLAVLPAAGVIAACTERRELTRKPLDVKEAPRTYTDDDEYVDIEPEPVETGVDAPRVPNPVWEARARQLEEDQIRVAGAVYTDAAAGVFKGKERSHLPAIELAPDSTDALRRVVVAVPHVMGQSGLDAGPYDAGADAAASDAAATADAGRDAGDAGDVTSDGGATTKDGDGGAVSRDAGTTGGDAAAAQPIHYVTTIYLRAEVGGVDTVVGLWEFASSSAAPPAATFTLPSGVTSLVAYEYCTLHGLWRSEPFAV